MTTAHRILLCSLLFWLGLTCLSSVWADEIRPAFLQLQERQPNVFDVLWKVPARGEEQRLALEVEFSDGIQTLTSAQGGFVAEHYLQRWQIQALQGLGGVAITVDGLRRTNSEALIRIEYQNGTSLVHRLTPTAPSYRVAATPSRTQVIATYLTLGVEHILFGIDHLLFVLTLLMLVASLRPLLYTITAFTVAHSITLSLAALELIRIPVPPVEACIALSIVFVAAEVVRMQKGQPGLAQRQPWVVAFAFGLLHGLGFAAALGEIGLPQSDIPAALLFFNVGVEIGQVLFVLSVVLLVRGFHVFIQSKPNWIRIGAAYAIGSIAMLWTIERTVSFLT